MKKALFTFLAAFICCTAFAQMSDEQVVAFVKSGMASGKNQSQIGRELLSKGVTASQARRIISLYKSGQLDQADTGMESTRQMSDVVQDRARKIMREGRDDDAGKVGTMSEEDMPQASEQKAAGPGTAPGAAPAIFGHDVFNNANLSFEPNENLATPADYVLGPGDEIVVDVWGLNEISIRERISAEGRIFISQVGPVQLSGMTIEQAKSKLTGILSQKYSLGGPDAASQISVTLGSIRTVQINILGEVNVPGTYRLSSFSTVFNALFRAKGVTGLGSLRSVQIVRENKVAATADIYKYIFEGSRAGDISLKDGDAIIVPSQSVVVQVADGFRRPMRYELLPGEKVSDLIGYAGGFTSDASEDNVSIVRKDGTQSRVFTVGKGDFASFAMEDGDIIGAYVNVHDIFANRVEVKGSVLRPGVYALGGEVATLRQLVESAGGLLEDAFTARAQLIREKPDRSLEVKAVALGAILNGTEPDILLRRSDILMVSNTNEMNPKGDVTITGYVSSPGNYQYAEGMGIEDIIMLAGGLESGASSVNVEVARRIFEDGSMEASDTIAQVFSCRIEDGMMVDGEPEFILQPYDVVAVRRNPRYVVQKRVTVSGEVTFPGEYVLTSNNERLSDVYRRAGGATPNGYVRGAMIKRPISEDERTVRTNLLRAARNTIDSTDFQNLRQITASNIGINLDKALAEPGGEYDVILRDGDEIVVPQNTNTVGIVGEVLFPNTVSYIEGKPLRYYIRKAGGFSQEAKRSKIFVVYLNGVAEMGRSAVIQPGCEIYVPSRPEHRQLTVGEWMSMGTTAASLSTMVATIVNLVKK